MDATADEVGTLLGLVTARLRRDESAVAALMDGITDHRVMLDHAVETLAAQLNEWAVEQGYDTTTLVASLQATAVQAQTGGVDGLAE